MHRPQPEKVTSRCMLTNQAGSWRAIRSICSLVQVQLQNCLPWRQQGLQEVPPLPNRCDLGQACVRGNGATSGILAKKGGHFLAPHSFVPLYELRPPFLEPAGNRLKPKNRLGVGGTLFFFVLRDLLL